ncbi:replication-relaxation family protein [Streptomyces sp. NBC_00140]|uniref:replication-relaxation family protein n=1 Tax=Streptomyces sp. NBC_00140 TaxID=2975664 RepID=UPI0022569336|nr:replication-relaxation family protein [Streptomyces sp. NBC_00140]MCX5327797.1 replication-relaxation family protein [Streptomyces sp. NBC_00140]MCX5336836.1 replication-relaxation family protein [Streptomyces sp. NBC_00140]
MTTVSTPKPDPSAAHPSPVEPLPHQLLAALALHRMATSQQLHTLLRPDAVRQTVATPLARLREQGLVDYTVLAASNRSRAWYLTGEGARLTRDFPALRGRPPYPITSATAASLKTPHTLTVVRTHLAFVADARRRGDEHGHLDWTPEVSHPLSDGERVIADAVMHYTLIQGEQRTKLRAFVEVDRSTMSSERLAAKLIEYARLWSYEPQLVGRQRPRLTGASAVWLRWYPVFPRVLIVLTGASRYVLANRISDLQAMTAQHPLVTALAREVPMGTVVLEDLEEHGPTADVWVPLAGGAQRSWTQL